MSRQEVTIKAKRNTKRKKLGKTEVFQFRISPIMRYALELIARYQRRTISSAFDVAVENYAYGFMLNLVGDKVQSFTQGTAVGKPLMDLVDVVWDQDPAVRFLNLAKIAEPLLSSDERRIWSVLNSQPYFKVNGEPNVELIKRMWNRLQEIESIGDINQAEVKAHLLDMHQQAPPEKLAAFTAAFDDLYIKEQTNGS